MLNKSSSAQWKKKKKKPDKVVFQTEMSEAKNQNHHWLKLHSVLIFFSLPHCSLRLFRFHYNNISIFSKKKNNSNNKKQHKQNENKVFR